MKRIPFPSLPSRLRPWGVLRRNRRNRGRLPQGLDIQVVPITGGDVAVGGVFAKDHLSKSGRQIAARLAAKIERGDKLRPAVGEEPYLPGQPATKAQPRAVDFSQTS